MNLTSHFTSAEFDDDLDDDTGTDYPVDETERIRRSTALCAAVLEPWRDRVGRIRINDGWRSMTRHVRLGGDPAKPSQHCTGDAADCHPLDHPWLAAWEALAQLVAAGLPVDQAILEYGSGETPKCIHVSHTVTREPRRQLLVERGGRYSPWATSGAESEIIPAPGVRVTS